MHFAAEMGDKIRQAINYGWKLPGFMDRTIENDDPFNHFPHEIRKDYFDWNVLVQGILNTRSGSHFVYKNELKKRKIDFYEQLGQLKDAHTVSLVGSSSSSSSSNNNLLLTSKYIVLAPGGRPHIPSQVPGALEHAITSDDLFSLRSPPGKTLIVGGGYIALECAGFLSGLGFDVSVMVRSQILRNSTFDREVVTHLQESMELNHKVRFLQPCIPLRIEKLENCDKKKVYYILNTETDKKEYSEEFDTVMFATGRSPDVKGLNLDAVGVQYIKEEEEGQKIIVDQEERTSVPSIFAIGDVIENGHNFELTPVAIQQGKYLAYRLFSQPFTETSKASSSSSSEERKTKQSFQLVDYNCVPTTVFTPLEYGLVGYSEEKAIQEFGSEHLVIYKKKFNILEYKIPEKAEKGFVKLICLKENERVIGLHYLGPQAAEVTQGFALALKKGCTKEEFDDLIGIHPSNAEAFVYLELGVYEDKTCCG